MTIYFRTPATALMFAAAMVCSNAAVAAWPAHNGFSASTQGAKEKRASTKQKAVAKVKKVQFLRGSEESVNERSARLKRECKGGVNAGACAGYTR